MDYCIEILKNKYIFILAKLLVIFFVCDKERNVERKRKEGNVHYLLALTFSFFLNSEIVLCATLCNLK